MDTQTSRAQIIATIGPASEKRDVLLTLINHGLDIARLNFAWGNQEEHGRKIDLIHELSSSLNKHIPIIIDLPGPRVQTNEHNHSYDEQVSVIGEKDEEFISFGIHKSVEYFALSFVGSAQDVEKGREVIRTKNGNQKIIAKIERKIALDNLELILEATDAVMVARGDLGREIPLPELPFAQARIIKRANELRKPVITATEMLYSMTKTAIPTRAEVTDVANAILQGSDAVMLSEETSTGDYPIEAVIMMEKIVLEAEKHLQGKASFNPL